MLADAIDNFCSKVEGKEDYKKKNGKRLELYHNSSTICLELDK
jgi:hypothetical protein